MLARRPGRPRRSCRRRRRCRPARARGRSAASLSTPPETPVTQSTWPVSGATPTTLPRASRSPGGPPASTPDAHSSGAARTGRDRAASSARRSAGRPPGGGGVAASSSRRAVPAAQPPPRRHPSPARRHPNGRRRAHFSSSSARRFVISSRNEVVGILVQHLVIDPRRLGRVALQLGDPGLVIERPVLVEAAQGGRVVPQLGEGPPAPRPASLSLVARSRGPRGPGTSDGRRACPASSFW